jgi:hypothetical protein
MVEGYTQPADFEVAVSRQPSSSTGPTKQQPQAAERRAAARYLIQQPCLVRPDGGSGAADWHGIAYNISAAGIGITLPCPLCPGTVLLIEPWNLPGTRRIRARVVRSAFRSFLWFHGCEFTTPLGEEELRAWATAGRNGLGWQPGGPVG